MQLLAISRRAVDGSLTILGDVAQATGPVVYRRWQELEPYLPEDTEISIEELRHAYRVPAEIMALALPLLGGRRGPGTGVGRRGGDGGAAEEAPAAWAGLGLLAVGTDAHLHLSPTDALTRRRFLASCRLSVRKG